MEKSIFILIDGNALVHRAFHALPPLNTSKGELVNAIYGFLLVFFKAVREFQPLYVAACFDLPAPTFRHKEFPQYKAQRPKAPKELYEQMLEIKKTLELMEVPLFEKEGFEADDLIGTIARKIDQSKKTENIETIILSGDLDTLQIVDKNTKVYTLKKGVKDTVLYTEDLVKKRYSIPPSLLSDFKGLMGDPSDNIPGVSGIGEKTASFLVSNFGTIENLYAEIEKNSKKAQIINPKVKEKLLEQKEQAFFSKMLAQIRFDVPLNFELKTCKWQYSKEKIAAILKKYEFSRLIESLPQNQNEREPSQKKLFS